MKQSALAYQVAAGREQSQSAGTGLQDDQLSSDSTQTIAQLPWRTSHPQASQLPDSSLVFGKPWHIENSEKLKKKNNFRIAPIA